MCTGLEPMMLIQGGAAALSSLGAYSSSQAAKTAYAGQAQVNRNNAQIAEWQAQDALQRGESTASKVRMRGNQLQGTQRAGLAYSGVDLGQGSAVQILTDTEYFTEVDAATAKDNAAREAWEARNKAAGFQSEASLFQSRSDAENPLLAGATSLLTNAGRVSRDWYTPTRSGPADFGAVASLPGALSLSSAPNLSDWDYSARSGDAGGETPWTRFRQGGRT